MKNRAFTISLALGALAMLPALASAQLSIPRYVIAGGGDRSTGGAFSLTGTISQAEAGPDTGPMTGGGKSVVSGFWAGNPPPCPADFDNDGFVNGNDFDAFVDAFFIGDIIADFDGNGFVTGDDYDAFVDSFAAGC